MTDHPSLVTRHLVVPLTTHPSSSMLEAWTWLIGAGKRPVLVTACGDVFVEDAQDGSIHFLDVSGSELTQVADSSSSLDILLQDTEFVEALFHPGRVEALRAMGMLLQRDQVYSFVIPLSLGGVYGVENIEVTDVEVHFSIAGQIAEQIAAVPDGGVVSGITLKSPASRKPWWRFW